MSFFAKFLSRLAATGGRPPTQCEVCHRPLAVIGNGGPMGVMMTREEATSGLVGAAEQCWECHRVYCENCYPNRPRNTCVCGRGRDAVRQVGGTTYRGSLHLVKVRYHG